MRIDIVTIFPAYLDPLALSLLASLNSSASAQWRDHRALSTAIAGLAQEHGTRASVVTVAT